MLGDKALLQQRRPARFRGESVAGGDAVAQHQHHRRSGGIQRSRRARRMSAQSRRTNARRGIQTPTDERDILARRARRPQAPGAFPRPGTMLPPRRSTGSVRSRRWRAVCEFDPRPNLAFMLSHDISTVHAFHRHPRPQAVQASPKRLIAADDPRRRQLRRRCGRDRGASSVPRAPAKPRCSDFWPGSIVRPRVEVSFGDTVARSTLRRRTRRAETTLARVRFPVVSAPAGIDGAGERHAAARACRLARCRAARARLARARRPGRAGRATIRSSSRAASSSASRSRALFGRASAC